MLKHSFKRPSERVQENNRPRESSLPPSLTRTSADRVHSPSPPTFELRPMTVRGLDLAGPSSARWSQQEDDRQALCVETSFVENDDRSRGCSNFLKRKLTRDRLKRSISVPFSPLHMMEVETQENDDTIRSTQERQIVPCEAAPVENTSGREHSSLDENLPPSNNSPASRPHMVRRKFTCYVPKKSTVAPFLSRRYSSTSVYINTVLAFTDICSYDQLEENARQTLAQMTAETNKHHFLQLAMLAVYLLRHRVVVVEGSLELEQQRFIAYTSFRDDTVGKVCCSDGDLLIIPKFHKDKTIQRTILSDLQVAMEIIHNLDGSYAPLCDRINDPQTITEEVREMNLLCENFPVKGIAPIDLFFKPVFTKKYYHMVRPKARLAVEVLQAAIIVFINLIEEALWNEDFGAALFLAQIVRQCGNSLLWILADDDLENTYLFTMMEWYWARCYYNVGSHWHKRSSQMKTRYSNANMELEKLNSSFFARMTHSDTLVNGYYFPKDVRECVKLCAEGYKKIAVPLSWRRSTFQKVSSVALNLHYRIMKWAQSVVGRKKGENFNANISIICETNTEIDKILLRPSNGEEPFPYYRVLLLSLSAKCCRFLAAFVDCSSVLWRADQPSLMTRIPYSYTYGEKRSIRQKTALELLIKVYRDDPSDNIKALLLKTARQTYFEEVIYLIQRQAAEPIRTGGLSTITRLLPYVLYAWFGSDVPTHPGGLEKAIPPGEKHIFDQIMAMMFMGSGIIYCLMFRASANTEEYSLFLNNAIYYHALAWPYLQRPTVTFGVLNAILDFLQLEETSTIEYHAETLENGASRCCAVLLRYVVTLLPILWEMCISYKHDYGPNEGERNIVISEVKYPVEYNTLRFGTSAEVSLLKSHDEILSYLHYDFGLSSSEHGKRVVLRGDVGPNKEPENFTPTAMYHNSLRDTVYTEVPSPPELLPPLTGDCGCLGAREGCPIERYHDIEERWFVPEDISHEELFYEVSCNLTPTYRDRKDCLDYLMLDLRKTVGRLLYKTISEFKALMHDGVEEMTIAENGCNPAYNLKLDSLLKDLTRTAGYLKFPDPPVLVITRVLSSLDEIFHDKQTHAMLRGSF